jgi:DNA-binding transcriptional ArsR family regulator
VSSASQKQRMNGDQPSHPIYVWNGILEPKHVWSIGPAIWVFLWCINRTTEERLTKEGDYKGLVLGGMPVTLGEISEELQVSEKTVSRHLKRLLVRGYLKLTLAPHGYVIRVCKSCRWPKEQKQCLKTIRAAGRTKVSDDSDNAGRKLQSATRDGDNSAPQTKVSDHLGQKCPQTSDNSVPVQTKVSDVIRSNSSYGLSSDESGDEAARENRAAPSPSPLEEKGENQTQRQPLPGSQKKRIWDSPEQRAASYAALDAEKREKDSPPAIQAECGNGVVSTAEYHQLEAVGAR